MATNSLVATRIHMKACPNCGAMLPEDLINNSAFACPKRNV